MQICSHSLIKYIYFLLKLFDQNNEKLIYTRKCTFQLAYQIYQI
jgi:hypothetical protein